VFVSNCYVNDHISFSKISTISLHVFETQCRTWKHRRAAAIPAACPNLPAPSIEANWKETGREEREGKGNVEKLRGTGERGGQGKGKGRKEEERKRYEIGRVVLSDWSQPRQTGSFHSVYNALTATHFRRNEVS